MNEIHNRNIRAVLFDFGGVLAEEGFVEGLRAIAEQQGLDVEAIPKQGMDAVYDSGYVLGQGSESDFWNLLRRRTGMRGDEAALRQEILSRFRLRPWMLDLVRRLKNKGYVIGILSDQTDWLEELEAQWHFMALFDQVFVSFSLGKGKRDPSLFDELACKLCLPPQQILFIDDAPGNIERARSRIWSGLVYRDRRVFEAELQQVLGIGLWSD